MSLLDLPVVQPIDADEGDDVHITCCDPDTAICGVTLEGEVYPGNTAVDCADCVEADEADKPCGGSLCRLRRWFRERLA